MTFDLNALTYTFDPAPSLNIGIIGDATPTGWDSDTDLTDDGTGVYTITIDLVEGGLKFRVDDAWDLNWGGATFPDGDAVENGDNIPVTADQAGTYDVTFDLNNLTYSFAPSDGGGGSEIESIGIIGDATPTGWDSDTDLVLQEDGTYQVIIALGEGAVKFRANDAWDINWGGTEFPTGTAIPNADDNIPSQPGLYVVTFDLENLTYSFQESTIGIIGSATPGGWDNDTDLMQSADNPSEFTGTMTLTDGEVKWRLNDEWNYDWGGTDFPSGTAEFKGPNLPATAGEYTVTFNVNTLEYRFE